MRGVSFTLGRERLGIVGESGSGKSMIGRAILVSYHLPARVTADRLAFAAPTSWPPASRQMMRLRGAASG